LVANSFNFKIAEFFEIESATAKIVFKAGGTYQPRWYSEGRWDRMDAGQFSSNLGSAFSSAISSSLTPPSSSSGGGGFSGGGRW